MRMERFRIALVSCLGVALLAAIGFGVYQSRNLTKTEKQRDLALKSLKETREALHQSQLQLAAAVRNRPRPANNNKAAIAQRDATIKQLTGQISAAQTSITQLEEKLSDASEENKKALAKANKHYQDLQTDLQNQINALQKKLKSAQGDIQNSRQRIADLEKSNAELKAQNTKGSAQTAEREHILANLQDLDRRREEYLRSIGNRYRDITNQFRTMSGMLGSNRGQDSNAFSGGALDLIQNAISLADNDLQHLSDLNARAFRLEKKLKKM